MTDCDSDALLPIEHFLRSASEERVIFCFLDMLAERTARLEQAIGADELAAVRAENRRLIAENRQLIQQVAAIDAPKLSQLLEFLPVIFRNVWGIVRPEEVAVLAQKTEVPRIPSPFPEPTAREIAASRQQLAQLPNLERVRIVLACLELKKRHALTIRAEMIEFFQE